MTSSTERARVLHLRSRLHQEKESYIAIVRYVQSLNYPQRDLNAWQRLRSRIERLIEQGPVPGTRTWRREDLYE